MTKTAHIEFLKDASGFGNESIVDRLSPDMIYLVDPLW